MGLFKKLTKNLKRLNPVTLGADIISELTTGKSLEHNVRAGVGAIKDLAGGLTGASADAARIQAEAAARAAEIEKAATQRALGLQTEYGERGISELRDFGGQAVTGIEGQQGLVRTAYDPYRQDAGRAFQLQQAFSGALGKEAQAKAYEGFTEGPGTAFLRSQGMRGLESEISASGRGGGSRLKAVSEFNQGLALQDFEKQFARLGTVTGTELAATGKMAGLTSGLEQSRAQALLGTGGQIGAATGRLGEGLAQTEMVGAGLLSESEMAAAAARAGGIVGAQQEKYDILGNVIKVGGAVAAL